MIRQPGLCRDEREEDIYLFASPSLGVGVVLGLKKITRGKPQNLRTYDNFVYKISQAAILFRQ